METNAFDAAALTYDADFDSLPQTARLRRIIHGAALDRFPATGTILELNCGTGTDAVALARHGLKVHATDASQEMIRLAAAKVMKHDLADMVRLTHLSFQELRSLSGRFYEGAFSNMGGLNCTSDLPSVARDLSTLLRPGRFLIACFLSRFCLWEIASFLVRGNLRASLRRLSQSGVDMHIHREQVRVYYHSPRSVQSSFAPYFEGVFLQGLNIFSPPPGSANAYKALGRTARSLERIDDTISRTPPFRSMGDHFLLGLRRTDG